MKSSVKRYFTRLMVLIAFIGAFLSVPPSVSAACPVGPIVSCNDTNYHKVNYIDVVVPHTSEVKMFVTPGFPVKVTITQGSTVLRTISYHSGTEIIAWDTRTVTVAGSNPVKIRYS